VYAQTHAAYNYVKALLPRLRPIQSIRQLKLPESLGQKSLTYSPGARKQPYSKVEHKKTIRPPNFPPGKLSVSLIRSKAFWYPRVFSYLRGVFGTVSRSPDNSHHSSRRLSPQAFQQPNALVFGGKHSIG